MLASHYIWNCWYISLHMSADAFPSTSCPEFIYCAGRKRCWGMIHLMRQAPRWAVFRDRRLQTVALWIEFQSEVKEKKIPWRKKVEFDPEARGSKHFSTEGISLFELRTFYDIIFKVFLAEGSVHLVFIHFSDFHIDIKAQSELKCIQMWGNFNLIDHLVVTFFKAGMWCHGHSLWFARLHR